MPQQGRPARPARPTAARQTRGRQQGFAGWPEFSWPRCCSRPRSSDGEAEARNPRGAGQSWEMAPSFQPAHETRVWPDKASCETLARGGGAAACQPGLTHAEILLAWLKSPLPISEGQTGDCPSFCSCPFSPSSAGLRPLGISKKPPEGSWVPACLCRGAPPPWGCPGGRQPASH